MKNFSLSLLAIIYTTLALSQNTFKAIIKDSESKETLFGSTAIVQGTTNGASADQNGFIEIKNISNGKHSIVFHYMGYSEKTATFNFPLMNTEPIEIMLFANEGKELKEVFISSTRSSRSISNIPTRMEAISGEELEEKGNMKPGDIRMMLNESTGIQTQQTSATSYNSSIRIQGLDGKYTQILRDGFPLYTGFSGA